MAIMHLTQNRNPKDSNILKRMYEMQKMVNQGKDPFKGF